MSGGRPLTGRVFRRGKQWYGSLVRRSDTGRTTVGFPTKEEAQAWVDEQLPRVRAGLDAIAPPASRSRRARPAHQPPARLHAPAPELPDPKAIAHAWHQERYEMLEVGNPDTSDGVLRDLELHVIPLLAAVVGSEPAAGRLIVVDWVRCQSGREPASALSPWAAAEPGYAKATVRGWLRSFRAILAYYRTLGYDVPDCSRGVQSMERFGGEKRRRTFVPLEQAVALAARLHIIHQSVLWIIRGAGLRISEAFGLLVGSLILDAERHGFLLVDQLGGRFQVRDADGNRHVVSSVQRGKSASAYRLVPLADSLTELLLTVIEVFHTDDEGNIDMGARLIPAIRKDDGGEQAFRQALTRAARDLQLVSDAPDDYCDVTPHAMRKGYNTDLAWDHDVPALVRLRTVGHKAGSDVNSLVYTLDRRLTADLRPAAESVERQLRAVTASLRIPTALRPSYARDRAEQARAYDARLLELGWQQDPHAGLIGVSEAAKELVLAESTTRRLLARGDIPAVKTPEGWKARPEDVASYRDTRLRSRVTLGDVAAQCAVGYDRAYKVAARLGLALDKGPDGALLLSVADVAAVRGECERLAALAERALPIGATANLLGTRHYGSVHRWVAEGRLAYDVERDGAGHRWVTKQSLRAELSRRGKGGHPARAEVMDAFGLDKAMLSALLKRGLLTPVRENRINARSLVAWVAGYRPDLFETPLYKRLAVEV
ncbi:MAG: hypothetical protein M0004_17135 [Actinomycetota bacterium]|nr:hypothetical protein [Actinomycetota bacterium]